MKRLMEKLGFHTPDEMERSILFRAQRNAYLFLMGALLMWSLYESWKGYTYHARLNMIPCFLLGTASLIQSFSQLFMTRYAVKDDEDSMETGPLLGLVVLGYIVVGMVIAMGVSFLLMGVRV